MNKYFNLTGNSIEIKAVLHITLEMLKKREAEINEEISSRFIQSAVLLPEGAFIGFQIDNSFEKEYVIYAFSSVGAPVAAQDFEWIFGCSADSVPLGEDVPQKIFDNSLKEYALIPPFETDNYYNTVRIESYSGYPASYFDRETLDCLNGCGGSVRIIAGAAQEDKNCHGTVIFTVPGEMPLRLQAELSLMDSDSVLTEVNKISEEKPVCLYDGLFLSDVSYILGAFKDSVIYKNHPDNISVESLGLREDTLNCLKGAGINYAGQLLKMSREELLNITDFDGERLEEIRITLAERCNVEDFPTYVDGKPAEFIDGDTPIDFALELTVRAVNCLKRARIDTIEKLLKMTEEDLLKVRNLGRKCTDEVLEKLAERNFVLNPPKKDEEGPAEAPDDEPDKEEDADGRPEEHIDGDTPIDVLDISVRSCNCLMHAGIDTIEKLLKLTDEDFFKVCSLGKKQTEEVKAKLAEHNFVLNPPKEDEGPSYMEQLDSLIGLKEVKEQVRKIAAFAKMKKAMAVAGNCTVNVALNMEFKGNPGTAKTTVARILAGIFHEIGLLSSRDFLEVGRADLIAKYVGHTAPKVREVFEKAKGKVLFIDEAYSLCEEAADSFGAEAIDTIVQEMENRRDETIVIFAGYPDRMQEFFQTNPGLRSRVPFTISFPDYSVDEMVQITGLEAKKRGFEIADGANEKIASICSAAIQQPDSGNGRFCRNLVENALLGYAMRVYGENNEASGEPCVLIADDFTGPVAPSKNESSPFGFCA